MAVDFEVSDEQVDDETRVVAVRGEVDLFTVPEFKEHLNLAMEADGRRVVVDLSETTFIDSSSLGVLIAAHRRLSMRGGRLVVACDVPSILKTFSITGLGEVLEIVPDRERALAAETA